jgi:PTH2 family peptidyl-tRNA hydrolase
MYNFKQVIVVRQKFPGPDGVPRKCRTGKYIAQACHASVTAVLQFFIKDGQFAPGDAVDWFDPNHQAKIAVYVDTEEELLSIYAAAIKAGLPASLIQDQGHTEFNGQLTYTCVAVGPGRRDEVDLITKHLPLM